MILFFCIFLVMYKIIYIYTYISYIHILYIQLLTYKYVHIDRQFFKCSAGNGAQALCLLGKSSASELYPTPMHFSCLHFLHFLLCNGYLQRQNAALLFTPPSWGLALWYSKHLFIEFIDRKPKRPWRGEAVTYLKKTQFWIPAELLLDLASFQPEPTLCWKNPQPFTDVVDDKDSGKAGGQGTRSVLFAGQVGSE
jgi:hypothetical protein